MKKEEKTYGISEEVCWMAVNGLSKSLASEEEASLSMVEEINVKIFQNNWTTCETGCESQKLPCMAPSFAVPRAAPLAGWQTPGQPFHAPGPLSSIIMKCM